MSDQLQMTDGMHIIVEALKQNNIDTIYGVVGIPVTDMARHAQAEGIRYIGFRHEQSAGYAAAASGFLTQKPGDLPDSFCARIPQWFDRIGQRNGKWFSDDHD